MNICLQASKNQTTYGENIVINSNVMTMHILSECKYLCGY